MQRDLSEQIEDIESILNLPTILEFDPKRSLCMNELELHVIVACNVSIQSFFKEKLLGGGGGGQNRDFCQRGGTCMCQ